MSSWLQSHVEGFIVPYLGTMPNRTRPTTFGTDGFTVYPKRTDKVQVAALARAWEGVKQLAKDRTILLPGRDTWEFEILARLEDHPTIFRPDISNYTKEHVSEDYSECFVVDSGLRGSVPKALKIKNFALCCVSTTFTKGELKSHDLALAVDPTRNTLYGQVSGLYNFLEGNYKYWTHARWENGSIVQKLSRTVDFEQAACMTLEIAEFMGHFYRPSYSRVALIKKFPGIEKWI